MPGGTKGRKAEDNWPKGSYKPNTVRIYTNFGEGRNYQEPLHATGSNSFAGWEESLQRAKQVLPHKTTKNARFLFRVLTAVNEVYGVRATPDQIYDENPIVLYVRKELGHVNDLFEKDPGGEWKNELPDREWICALGFAALGFQNDRAITSYLNAWGLDDWALVLEPASGGNTSMHADEPAGYGETSGMATDLVGNSDKLAGPGDDNFGGKPASPRGKISKLAGSSDNAGRPASDRTGKLAGDNTGKATGPGSNSSKLAAGPSDILGKPAAGPRSNFDKPTGPGGKIGKPDGPGGHRPSAGGRHPLDLWSSPMNKEKALPNYNDQDTDDRLSREGDRNRDMEPKAAGSHEVTSDQGPGNGTEITLEEMAYTLYRHKVILETYGASLDNHSTQLGANEERVTSTHARAIRLEQGISSYVTTNNKNVGELMAYAKFFETERVSTESQLKDTKFQLEITKSELKDTKSQLENTNSELEDTKSRLNRLEGAVATLQASGGGARRSSQGLAPTYDRNLPGADGVSEGYDGPARTAVNAPGDAPEPRGGNKRRRTAGDDGGHDRYAWPPTLPGLTRPRGEPAVPRPQQTRHANGLDSQTRATQQSAVVPQDIADYVKRTGGLHPR